jgi:leucyl aminopeptidase (aminopeptidase T)
MGLKIPEDRLFCDWLISEEQFVRLNSCDIDENTRYQKHLRTQLNTVDTIFISTESGTNIRFVARNWIIDRGEIFCTPIETETNGLIVVDGCAYYGPPLRPVKLNIRNGRVVNIDDLSEEDEQEKWIRNDLTTDDNASILAEVGIGTNKKALWKSDLMESEQSRGTCHFGFGMNLNYGGRIESKKHFDLVVLNPTIMINGTLVYENGIMMK